MERGQPGDRHWPQSARPARGQHLARTDAASVL